MNMNIDELVSKVVDEEKMKNENKQQNGNKDFVPNEKAVVTMQENTLPSCLNVSTEAEKVRNKILQATSAKIQTAKLIDKHSDGLKEVVNKQIENDIERENLIAEQVNADNKVIKQEIKNRLIVLNAEAKRLQKEQSQLSKDQREQHKTRNDSSNWEKYKHKLERMNYSYVPNFCVLKMLLFFDGVKSFLEGIGTISTAILKALKWILLIGGIAIVLFSIPITREWIINLLSAKT